MRLYRLSNALLVESDRRWFRLPGVAWDEAVNRDDLHDWLVGRVADTTIMDGEPDLSSVLPPIGKQQRYPALTLTVIHAEERGTPKNRKKIEWKLITDLPVQSRQDAIERLEWYALRWKIEVFHKILKSGC